MLNDLLAVQSCVNSLPSKWPNCKIKTAFFTVLLQWKRHASWQRTPNGALEKCVGTKGPTCDQRWRDICWDPLWGALVSMTLLMGFIWEIPHWQDDNVEWFNSFVLEMNLFLSTYLATLEIFGHDSQVLDARSGPFFCCQMMFPICPEFAPPKMVPWFEPKLFHGWLSQAPVVSAMHLLLRAVDEGPRWQAVWKKVQVPTQ